jgi:hypothetical protein
MKFKTLTLAMLLAVSTGFVTVHAGGDHSAKHAGIVVATKTLDFEIVAKPDLIQIYVDEHGKALKLDGAKAKLTLLNGAEKSEVELVPVGDKLEAKGNFKVVKGTKGIASVTLAGKPAATARFEIK